MPGRGVGAGGHRRDRGDQNEQHQPRPGQPSAHVNIPSGPAYARSTGVPAAESRKIMTGARRTGNVAEITTEPGNS